jgi:hypothetical protein
VKEGHYGGRIGGGGWAEGWDAQRGIAGLGAEGHWPNFLESVHAGPEVVVQPLTHSGVRSFQAS